MSYSEEALRWIPPEVTLPPCTGLDFDFLGARSSSAQKQNAVRLHEYATAHASALGLSKDFPIQPHSFHPVHRVSPRGMFVFDFVVEFLQQTKAPLDPKNPRGPSFTFRGGTTVIFNQDGNIRYSIRKRIGNKHRLAEEREFHRHASSILPAAPFVASPVRQGLNFAATHRGF